MNELDILVGVVGFSLLVFWCLIRPESALIVLISASVVLPVEVSVHYGSMPRISPIRILLAAMFCAELYRLFVLGRKIGRLSGVPLFRWIVALLIYKASVSLISIDLQRSFISVASMIVEFMFPFYLLWIYIEQPGFWSKLRKTLYVVAVVVCVLALLEEITRANPLINFLDGEQLEVRAGLLRVRSTFFHPIALACFINLLMPLVLIDLFSAKAIGRKCALFAFSLLLVLISVMTVSRVPLLLLTVEIAIVYASWLRVQARSLLLRACCIGIVISGILFAVMQSETLSSMVKKDINPNHISYGQVNEASSEYYRIALLEAVVNRLQGWRWIIGVGPGTFQIADVEASYDGYDHILTAPDSHYIRVLLELGILGVILSAILGGKVLTLCWRAICRVDSMDKVSAIGAAVAVAAFFAVNATVSMFGIFPLSNLFWLHVAICAHMIKSRGIDRSTVVVARRIEVPG